MNEEKYIKGFNCGYILAKYEPKLLAQVTLSTFGQCDYIEGLHSGKKSHEYEVLRENVLSLTALRNKSSEKNNDLGQDI